MVKAELVHSVVKTEPVLCDEGWTGFLSGEDASVLSVVKAVSVLSVVKAATGLSTVKAALSGKCCMWNNKEKVCSHTTNKSWSSVKLHTTTENH